MKILYTTAIGKKVDLDNYSDIGSARIVDMDVAGNAIENALAESFEDVEIFRPGKDYVITPEFLTAYDLVLCDLTTSNPNVVFDVGVAEGIGKPVIYMINSEFRPAKSFEHKKILSYSESTLKGEFQEKLFEIISLAKKDPSFLLENIPHERQPKVFISYSHQDKSYLDRIMIHFKPLVRKGLLDVWSDTKIKVGDRWRDEIDQALEDASIAILLVSADFMASDFIIDNELPPILSKAEINGTRILPVVLSPCRFAREPELSRFQSANNPSQPLSSMSTEEREVIYDRLMAEVERNMPSKGN